MAHIDEILALQFLADCPDHLPSGRATGIYEGISVTIPRGLPRSFTPPNGIPSIIVMGPVTIPRGLPRSFTRQR